VHALSPPFINIACHLKWRKTWYTNKEASHRPHPCPHWCRSSHWCGFGSDFSVTFWYVSGSADQWLLDYGPTYVVLKWF
jgi:hypothetical protein